MKKLLRDIHTADAKSSVYDWVRVALSLSLVTGLGLLVYSVVGKDAAFDFAAFGTGIGLIIAAGGGAMWARKDVEQSKPEPPTK
jgi:hypothetical protein